MATTSDLMRYFAELAPAGRQNILDRAPATADFVLLDVYGLEPEPVPVGVRPTETAPGNNAGASEAGSCSTGRFSTAPPIWPESVTRPEANISPTNCDQ